MKTRPLSNHLVRSVLLLASSSAWAQTYNSGSTALLGDLNLPPAPTAVTLPTTTDGVYHYGSINIPAGVTVSIPKTPDNMPIYILATGNVQIDGTIQVNGADGVAASAYPPVTHTGGVGGTGGAGRGGLLGGPGNTLQAGGGPSGGKWMPNPNPGFCAAFGPGGASAVNAAVDTSGGAALALPVAQADWLLIYGGSGGGSQSICALSPGGGGGGAITIASSLTISVNGRISAKGGNGLAYGGGGGGGSIRLAAHDIVMGPSGFIDASAGFAASNSGAGRGGPGIIRLDAYTATNYVGKVNPSGIYLVNPPQPALPPYAISHTPKVTISHVNSQVPFQPLDSFPPSATVSPGANVTVEVTANYVPPGTTVTVLLRPVGFAAVQAVSSALVGTLDSSVATASLAVPAGSRVGSIDAWINGVPVPP